MNEYSYMRGAEILRVTSNRSTLGRFAIWVAVIWEFPTLASLTYSIFTEGQDQWGQVAHLGLVRTQAFLPRLIFDLSCCASAGDSATTTD